MRQILQVVFQSQRYNPSPGYVIVPRCNHPFRMSSLTVFYIVLLFISLYSYHCFIAVLFTVLGVKVSISTTISLHPVPRHLNVERIQPWDCFGKFTPLSKWLAQVCSAKKHLRQILPARKLANFTIHFQAFPINYCQVRFQNRFRLL